MVNFKVAEDERKKLCGGVRTREHDLSQVGFFVEAERTEIFGSSRFNHHRLTMK